MALHVSACVVGRGESGKEHPGSLRFQQACPPCHFPTVSLETNPVPLDDATAGLLASMIVKVAYPFIN